MLGVDVQALNTGKYRAARGMPIVPGKNTRLLYCLGLSPEGGPMYPHYCGRVLPTPWGGGIRKIHILFNLFIRYVSINANASDQKCEPFVLRCSLKKIDRFI